MVINYLVYGLRVMLVKCSRTDKVFHTCHMLIEIRGPSDDDVFLRHG